MQTQITRSNRRTICIQIHPEKGVIIRAPRFASNWRIDKFLKEKEKWILKTLEKVQQNKHSKPTFKFEPGEKFPYLGELVQPTTNSQANPLTDISQTNLPAYTHKPQTSIYKRQDVIAWYKEKALSILTERTLLYAKILSQKLNRETHPTKIKIRNYRSRWGTCSANNQITYNWRVVIAPIEIVDYLIIHELCHIVHKNHSKKFYELVSFLDPNYKKNRKYLRSSNASLDI
jgi:predicted metal-dependent hydrolase